jgi:tetratricopeptide (TPR) repeat protein
VWEADSLSSPAAKARLRQAARALRWHLSGAKACFEQKSAAGLALHRKRIDAAKDLAGDEALARGELYGRLGLWQQAARDYERAFRLSELEEGQQFRLCAGLLLRTGNRAGYRQVCRRLLERHGNTEDATTAAEVAAACVQAPGGVADGERVVRLAQRAVTRNPRSGWYQHVLALTYLRTGKADEAVRHARRSLEVDPGWEAHRPLSWLVLALALGATGQDEEARAWQGRAEKAITELARAAALEPCGGTPPALPWGEWLSMLVLLDEVKKEAVRRDSL